MVFKAVILNGKVCEGAEAGRRERQEKNHES